MLYTVASLCEVHFLFFFNRLCEAHGNYYPEFKCEEGLLEVITHTLVRYLNKLTIEYKGKWA